MRAAAAVVSASSSPLVASLATKKPAASQCRCSVAPLSPSSCFPLLSSHRSRSGASASPSSSSSSRIDALRSPAEAEVAEDRSSLVAVSPLLSTSTSSTTAAAPLFSALLLLLLLAATAAMSPETSQAATEAASAASSSSISSLPHVTATLADLDPSTAASLASLLRPVFALAELLFIVRIVLTWYPAVDGEKLPWAIVIKPTEPFLVGTRKVVPPLAGVDVSPVVWVALLSFISEILVGPQGILILLSRKVGGG